MTHDDAYNDGYYKAVDDVCTAIEEDLCGLDGDTIRALMEEFKAIMPATYRWYMENK